jgi:hypothetical protein
MHLHYHVFSVLLMQALLSVVDTMHLRYNVFSVLLMQALLSVVDTFTDQGW